MKKVEHHVHEEEDKVFPQARQILGEQRMQTLTQSLQQAKSLALPSVQNSVPAQELGLGGNTTAASSVQPSV